MITILFGAICEGALLGGTLVKWSCSDYFHADVALKFFSALLLWAFYFDLLCSRDGSHVNVVDTREAVDVEIDVLGTVIHVKVYVLCGLLVFSFL